MTNCESIDREQYLMMVQGLEQMADLYKHTKKPTRQVRFRQLYRQEGVFCVCTIAKKTRKKVQTTIIDSITHRKRLYEKANHHFRTYLRLLFKSKQTFIAEGSAINRQRMPLSYEGGRYFRDGKIAVYMAMFGDYDRIPEPIIQPNNIDYYILTDKKMPEDSKWRPLDPKNFIPEDLDDNPILCNRWCKMHPHIIFSEYEVSIYLDSNILVVSDLTPFATFSDLFPVAMFHHWQRNCVYKEIQACLKGMKDSEANLTKHEHRLREQGIPEDWGLVEAPVIARNHRDKRCVKLMETWWKNYISGSRRDQLSLIETLWQHGICPEQIATLGNNIYLCNMIIKTDHRKQMRK